MRRLRLTTMPPRRDDRDFRRAAADVDDEAAGRLTDGQAGADRRGHGLLDQARPAAPALSAASRTARFSTSVTPMGCR